MTSPNSIENLGRAIFAQLSPLTGTRATATITVTAEAGGGDVVLEPNTYLAPIPDGQIQRLWLFKVLPNPATVTGIVEHGTWQGGQWTVPDGASLVVNVTANLGGSQHNLPVNTPLRFVDPVPGLQVMATFATAGTGGAGGGLVRRMTLWQLFNNPQAAFQHFMSGTGEFPAIMLCWVSSSPLEGRTTGGRQGSTRKGRRARIFQENFSLYITTGKLTDAHTRRGEGETIMTAATGYITDRRLNIDCEPLTQMGSGVEVTGRSVVVANRGMYIYRIDFVCNAAIIPDGDSAVDARVYPSFDHVELNLDLPGGEPPEPTDTFPLVADVIIDL